MHNVRRRIQKVRKNKRYVRGSERRNSSLQTVTEACVELVSFFCLVAFCFVLTFFAKREMHVL